MGMRWLFSVRGLAQLFGILFCLHWGCTMLAFPLYKGRLEGYAPVVLGLLVGGALCVPGVRQGLSRWLLAWPKTRFLLGLVVLALALRLAAILVFPVEPVNDHRYFHRYAVNLLDGKGYGGIPWPHLRHLDGNGGLRAFYPPGMTFLLAAWYQLTGAGAISGKVLNCLIGTGMVLLLYDIGRRLRGNLVGRWAGLTAAVLPTLVFYSASLGYEIVLGTLFCLVLEITLICQERVRWYHALALGLVLGFGTLVKPVCLLVPGLLLVWWLWLGLGWRSLAWTAVVLVVQAAVVAPWTVRNYYTFHQFVPVSTNGGYVLYSANNPESYGFHMPVEPLPGETDEVAMDRARSRAAVSWILAHPADFLRLAAMKTTITWGTASTIMSFLSCDRMTDREEQVCMATLNTAWTALLVVCFFATCRAPLWGERRFLLALLLLVYLAGLQLVFEAESRHHIPALAPLLLVAANGLAAPPRRLPLREATVQSHTELSSLQSC